MSSDAAKEIVRAIEQLVIEVIHDRVTYPESGNYFGVQRAKDDLRDLLERIITRHS